MVPRSVLVKHDVSDLHAECREPERPGSAPDSPAAGIALDFVRRDALAEAPGGTDRSAADWGGTDTSRSAPAGKGERAAHRRG